MSRKTFRQHHTPAARRTSPATPVVVDSPAPTSDPRRLRPSDDEIRTLAYFKWEQAGCPGGDGCEFWFTAENALTAAPAK